MESARVDVSFFQSLFELSDGAAAGRAVSSASTSEPSSARILALWRRVVQEISPRKIKKNNSDNTLLQQLQAPATEDDIQKLMTFVHNFCCVHSPLVLRDTSDGSCAPLQPHHKFDHCAVPIGSSSVSPSSRVSWYDVVFPEQLKKSLAESDLLKEARLQLADVLSEILDKQPERRFAVGFISDGQRIQFYHLSSEPLAVMTSGLLSFLQLPPSSSSVAMSSRLDFPALPAGFALYAALLSCTPSQLGHAATLIPTIPAAVFATRAGRDVDQTEPATVIRRGDDYKPNVFQVTMKNGKPAVLKSYPRPHPFARESEALQKLDSSLPIPQLLSSIDQPDLHCLLVRPVAAYSLYDAPFSIGLFASAVSTGCRVLAALHQCGLIHGDVSPSNCLVVPTGAASASASSAVAAGDAPSSLSAPPPPSVGDAFVCLLNDFGCSGRADAAASHFVGTHDFAAPAWAALVLSASSESTPAAGEDEPLQPVRRTALNDYCSLFFTLLLFADTARSRRLPWSRESSVTVMWGKKLALLLPPQREALLQRAHPILKPFLRRLAACVLDLPNVDAVQQLLREYTTAAAFMGSIAE